MQWNDLLGFLIVLFIFLLPLIRMVVANKHRKGQKAEEPIEEEVVVEEHKEVSHPVPPIVTHRTVGDSFEFHSRLEPKKKKRKAHLAYNPLATVMKGKTPLQTMMIASEIMRVKDEP